MHLPHPPQLLEDRLLQWRILALPPRPPWRNKTTPNDSRVLPTVSEVVVAATVTVLVGVAAVATTVDLHLCRKILDLREPWRRILITWTVTPELNVIVIAQNSV